ncbi:MAG TPA: hypothetical protein P5179_08215 [Candidatus Latescibacteria bacterium]|nr:hypothetical protein [Candidatus Latescibacterota bacterium]
MGVVRDRLWIWGHEAGSHNEGWGVPSPSRMTPAEAAWYMGIPNVIFVTYQGKPEPPYDIYARAFVPLKNVVWSIVGEAGRTSDAAITGVRDVAAKFPNITGVMMDDFFHDPKPDGSLAPISHDRLQSVRATLDECGRKLDMWVVVYTHQLDLPIAPFLDKCDVVTLWTWRQEDLVNVERNLERIEALAPGKRVVLGCYMWDYGNKCEMSVENMKLQCSAGLRWLTSGRIHGMIFLASCVCDIELPAVEWTRRWISEHGDTVL